MPFSPVWFWMAMASLWLIEKRTGPKTTSLRMWELSARSWVAVRPQEQAVLNWLRKGSRDGTGSL